MSEPKRHNCIYCGWYGSLNDPLIQLFRHEQMYCLRGAECRERQAINRNRQEAPDTYSTGVDGYSTAPQ